MNQTVTFLMLLALGVFISLNFCAPEKKNNDFRSSTVSGFSPSGLAHRPAEKVFPIGKAKHAAEEQPELNTGKMRVIFDTRGAVVRQVFRKDYGLDKDVSLEEPDNWVPVIDPRIYEAMDLGGSEPLEARRNQGNYFFSFRLRDHLTKFNLYQPPAEEGGKAIKSDPAHISWAFEEFAEDGGTRGIRFSLPMDNGLELVKEYRLTPGDDHLDLRIVLRNTDFDCGNQSSKWSMLLLGPSVVPSQKFMLGPEYTINDFYGKPRAVAVVENTATGQLVTSVLPAETGNHGQPLASPNGSQSQLVFTGALHKYFSCFIKPDKETRRAVKSVKTFVVPGLSPVPTWSRTGELKVRADAEAGPNSHIIPRLKLSIRVPDPGKESSYGFMIYMGPKDVTLWNRIPEYNDFYQAYLTDFDIACCSKVPGVSSIGRVLLKLLRYFQSLVGNWGVAILMLTIMVRLLLVPFNYKSQLEMNKYQKRMTKVKPLMDAIRKKYEKNKQKMNQELMALQKKHKITPPIMGCLPMFITMPVFIGLFTALRVSFDLRHKPFFLWIEDLSMPDMFMRLHENTEGIWGYIPSYLNVLPLLMTFLWWFQQRLMPKSDDPQQKQMQTMMQFMPILFGFILYNYAAGMALYMCISSLFGIFEARIIRKKVKAMDNPVAS